MPNNEDSKLPKQDSANVVIPTLKKKEKEKKKAGGIWGSTKPAGSPFVGATAGQGATVGFDLAAELAQSIASFIARFSSMIATLTGTLLGKFVAMALIALLVGGTAALAYKVFRGGGAASRDATDLGSIASAMKVPRETDDSRLKYAAESSQGQLDWEYQSAKSDTQKAADSSVDAAKPDEAAKAPDAGAQAAADNAQPADSQVPRPHLSGSLNGGFGAHSSFKGGGGFAGLGGAGVVPHYGPAKGMIGKFGQGVGKSGKGGALQAKNIRTSSALNMKHLASGSSKTLALLRGMATKYNPSIRSGGSKATEVNAAAAQAQFEASDITGAASPTSPTDSAGTPGGASAGGGTTGDSLGSAPDQSTIENCSDDQYWDGSSCTSMNQAKKNVTPWQALVDTCMKLVLISAALIIIGSIIAQIAKPLLATPLGQILMVLAGLMILLALGMAIMVIVKGVKINSMGGSPQGNIFITSGVLLTVAAAMALMCPMVNLLACMLIPAILAIGACILPALGK